MTSMLAAAAAATSAMTLIIQGRTYAHGRREPHVQTLRTLHGDLLRQVGILSMWRAASLGAETSDLPEQTRVLAAARTMVPEVESLSWPLRRKVRSQIRGATAAYDRVVDFAVSFNSDPPAGGFSIDREYAAMMRFNALADAARGTTQIAIEAVAKARR